MSWFSRKKERERFYLLPGMGGRNLRHKRKIILRWSVAAGMLTAAILGAVIYYLGTH